MEVHFIFILFRGSPAKDGEGKSPKFPSVRLMMRRLTLTVLNVIFFNSR